MSYKKEQFNIIDCGRYITIVNVDGEYENHCHLNKGHKKSQMDTAHMLVRLMKRKRVPKSDYLRNCVLRVSLDEKYKQEVRIKIDKDRDKTRYNNVPRNLRR